MIRQGAPQLLGPDLGLQVGDQLRFARLVHLDPTDDQRQCS